MLKNVIKILLALVVLLGVSGSVSAATLKGKVIDKSTDEPLVGATVVVKGTTKGVTTNLDGSFEINLDRKPQTLSIAYISYTTQEVAIENKSTHADITIKLETDTKMIDAVKVTAQVVRHSEFAAIADQKNSLFATQVVAVKELSRKGVGDAQGAVMKVSGISKQEGVKNVFVRGLGDRYNSTTLNGLPIPSEDPEYKNISLDFFSTDIIESVIVNKAFYAPGVSDVGGANINITSKKLVGDSALSLSVSGGINSQTIGADVVKMDGVNAFGFANNAKPSNASTSYDFANSMTPTSVGAKFDRSLGISGGKRFEIAGNPLTFYAVAAYDRGTSFTEETNRSSSTTNTLFSDQEGAISELSTSYLGLANVNYSIGSRHTIDYNFMYVHSNVQSVSLYNGMNVNYSDWGGYDTEMGAVLRQQTNDNSMYINQLISKWSLTDRMKLEAAASYNSIVGLEPDRRINSYGMEDDGTYSQANADGDNQRFYSELSERDLNVQAALVYSLSRDVANKSAIKVGYAGRFVGNEFNAIQYNHTIIAKSAVPSYSDLMLDDYFNADGLADGNFSIATTNNSYEVSKSIHSTYADLTYQISEKFIANVGFKYDMVDIDVEADLNGSPSFGGISDSYFLPSLNLRYSASDKHSLRLSVSKTYTLPQSKELSPYQYIGASFNSQGNPDLKVSDNYNLDLKWDWYISQGEILSVTGFYKHIANPIARITINSAGNFLSYENISDKAVAAGVELEFRKNIYTKELGDSKSNKLSFGLNGSYIYTDVEIYAALAPAEERTQLEGAAPIIANADISFVMERGTKRFTNTVVFNYVSDKIYSTGTNGYKNTIESDVPTLDFVSSAKLSDKLSLSLKANNLLNPEYILERESKTSSDKIVLNSYKKGVDVSLGLSYNF
ncbi:MAG: TonB-dependent receptor [Rikenellaceae bacterium]